MQDSRQFVFRFRAKNRMHMIGHDAPGEQVIAFLVKVRQSAGDDLCDARDP